MAIRPRRNHSPAIQGDKTLVELSEHFDVHANQITQWKQQLQERASEAFAGRGPEAPPVDVKVLHAKIGELTLENGFSYLVVIINWYSRKVLSWRLSTDGQH
jgi:transposase